MAALIILSHAKVGLTTLSGSIRVCFFVRQSITSASSFSNSIQAMVSHRELGLYGPLNGLEKH